MSRKTLSRGLQQTVTIRRMVITAMLGAVTALLTFTPVGMIMLPPPLPAVTLVHIPVILAALADGPLPFDALLARAGMTATEALALLTVLELRGLIRQLPGRVFERVPRA